MGCSHPTSNFTTLCKKKTASAFLHADGFWRRWWVLPRPKNSPLGCFCPAGRKAPGTGCSHPTSNFTTLCKKKTASAFLHADGSGGDGGFSRALKTAHRAVFARRDAKRRARAVLIPPATSLHRAKRKPPALFFTLTASGGDGGFSRALKTAHWAVFARRDAKRRARAVLIPPATSLHRAKRKPPALFFTLTASGGDGGIRTHVPG